MLRKTSHQRNSMKRTSVYNTYNFSTPRRSGYDREDRYESNVVYNSSSNRARRDSGDWSPNEMVRMSEKYGIDESWGRDKPKGGSKSVTAEIAPGIIVEGYEAEL